MVTTNTSFSINVDRVTPASVFPRTTKSKNLKHVMQSKRAGQQPVPEQPASVPQTPFTLHEHERDQRNAPQSPDRNRPWPAAR
jgi:hypothetical protein